jgi:hypothetical protein
VLQSRENLPPVFWAFSTALLHDEESIPRELEKKYFVQRYLTAHHLETNKLRNVAKFFAHLSETDTLPWHASGWAGKKHHQLEFL